MQTKFQCDSRGGYNRYNCNINFFEQWTDKMAYVLGFIYADGSLEDAWYLRGKYFRIANTNRPIVRKIKNALDSRHTIVKRSYLKSKRKSLYLLRIGSHKMYDDLIGLGLYPRKSLSIKFPKVPSEYLSYFVRGYFDGDGSIIFNRNGRWIRVVFTSGSRDFLEQLSEKIAESLKIRKRPIYISHRSYQLCYFTQEGLKLLNFVYKGVEKDNLYLDRKYYFYKKLAVQYNYILDKHITQMAR